MADSILNVANCGISTNMGVNSCVTNPGIIRWAIAVPKGTVIPASSMTTAAVFNAYLLSLFKLDNGSARARLLPAFTMITDNTGDPVTEAQGNFEFKVADRPYNWTFRMNTNFCSYRNMATLFELSQDLWDFLFVDENNAVMGTLRLDSTGANGLSGISMAQVTVPNWKTKTDSTNTVYTINFLIQNNQDLISGMQINDSNFTPNPATMGLVDVRLAAGDTASTATVLYVKGFFECGGGNIGDTYGSDIAAASAWSVVPAAGGAAIVPSGVVYNSTLKQYALTIASTPATALVVGLAVPSVLTATPYFKYAITETRNKVTITTP